MVHDDKWLQTEYLDGLKIHKENLDNSLQRVPSISEAHSIVSLLSDWWNGSAEGQLYSLGVPVYDQYELTEGVFYSLPVKFQPGNWEVVEDLDISAEQKEQLKKIEEELKREIAVIFPSSVEMKNEEVKPGENKMVFGNEAGDGLDEQGGTTKKEEGTHTEQEADATRIGPLSRIIEESESESKEGTTTATEK